MTGRPVAEVAKGVGGFVLGAVMVVVLPPLTIAIALVLGGVMLWLWRLKSCDAYSRRDKLECIHSHARMCRMSRIKRLGLLLETA